MNKPRKPTGAITHSDPLIFSDNQAQSAVKPGIASTLPEVRQDTAQVWKTFELGRYTEKENASWMSMIYDLLHNLDELSSMFRFELQHRSWLNAYLLAAGINQIVEDYLHTNTPPLGKVTKYLEALPAPMGSFFSSCSRALKNYWNSYNEKRQATRRLINWQQQLAKLVNELAEAIIDPSQPDDLKATHLIADGGTLMAYIPYFPAPLRHEIVRLPSCFRSTDQQPEDLRRMVDEFIIHWPERDRHLTVIGVRTSGNYLAPLYAAILKSAGYSRIQVLTLRPETTLNSAELFALREVVVENGLAILCDDPPITGNTMAQTAAILENAGIPPRSIVQFLQLFGDYEHLPDSLQRYPSVLLSWINWSIHRKLELPRIKKALASTCAELYKLTEIMRLPYFDGIDRHEHVGALFRVKLLDLTTDEYITRLVLVKGVGLGYFGEHSLAVARRLREYSAQVIALHEGLFYQEITTPSQTLEPALLTKEEKVMEQVVSYILERNRQLPAAEDITLQLSGRNAVWEVASNLLSKAFGRSWYLARLPLIDPYIKQELKATQPSIIDGDMALYHWYLQQGNNKPLVKMYLAERDFTHIDLTCYDPVYDLANLALEIGPDVHLSTLRKTYEAMSGDHISPERWMLYQLVHLWDSYRQDSDSANLISRRMAQVLQRYFSEIYFQDVKPNWGENRRQELEQYIELDLEQRMEDGMGPEIEFVEDESFRGALCAIDIDDVLETKQLGFPSLSPESARSLRALTMHGYRVVLATGRSIDEVVERSAAYHLAGGVAEYGAVLYDHRSGQIQPLLTQTELDILYKVRSKLSNTRAVYLDNDYRFAVRAYWLDENGNRMRLSNEMVEQVLAEIDTIEQVYAIQSDSQTDFMVRRIDKGVGIQKWSEWFGAPPTSSVSFERQQKPYSLVVGDSASDLPMFPLAQMAFAPGNASISIKQSGISTTNRLYQRGLEQAVSKLIGHTPGSCDICRLHSFSSHTLFMQDILSIQAEEPLSTFWRAIKLFMRNGGRLNVSG